ncbi:MAG: alpha-galactosidase [Provencibacterium sp.]|nr:alpha-galactosidase [Provencibacterium sp.]
MAIHFHEQTGVFILETQHSEYQMRIGRLGYLQHLYYGGPAGGSEMSHLVRQADRGFSGNPYDAGEDRTFSLDTLPQEYPAFGSGDFRESSLRAVYADGSSDTDLRYRSHSIFSGKAVLKDLPSFHGGEGEVETLEIVLSDALTGLSVALQYNVFAEKDIITRSAVIKNESGQPVQISRVLSCSLDYADGKGYEYITFYGRHAMERNEERTPVRHGEIVASSIRGASSHQQNPFVILCEQGADEEHGRCYGLSFVYSGNFIAGAQLDQFDSLRLYMGIHPEGFNWLLKAGESFATPEVALCYSGEGLGELSRRFHRACRENLCRGVWRDRRRPILVNNWEATYFDFDDDKLVKIAQEASQLGIEMLVMDDGWFGKREADVSGLGDWTVNEKKLRGGLGSLCERVNALGMKLGIWFEPEMVSEDSDLYRAHPDWVLRSPGRKGVRSRCQFVLDMSRGDVVDYLFEAISRVLSSANIAYVKWDMNRHLTNVFSAKLPAGQQGEIYHRYMLGVYELLERLTGAFPEVLFEGCSGGGGRFDAGMLYYTPQIWCSDDTDAIERLQIQYGTSFGYPISAVGAHLSACPNHQTGRVTPFDTRALVAMAGTFGYELDISRLSPEEKQQVREQTAFFKKNYALISGGDYYRLTGPAKNPTYAAWEFVSPDRGRALVCYVAIHAQANAAFTYLYPRGLRPQGRYAFTVSDEQYLLTGAAIMQGGIPMPRLSGDYRSLTIELEEV